MSSRVLTLDMILLPEIFHLKSTENYWLKPTIYVNV